MTVWSMKVIENPRYPLACMFFIYGLVLVRKKQKKGYLFYIFSIITHLSYLPMIIISLISKLNKPKLFKIFFLTSIGLILIDFNLISYLVNFFKDNITNPYISQKINSYFFKKKYVEETVKIIWVHYYEYIYYMLFQVYLIFDKVRKDYLQNILFLTMGFINLLFHYQTVFYRYVSSIVFIIIIYLVVTYNKNSKIKKQIIVLFHSLTSFYLIILWLRLFMLGFENYTWLNNIFTILFMIK